MSPRPTALGEGLVCSLCAPCACVLGSVWKKLVACHIVVCRYGNPVEMPGHSAVLSVLGTVLLWFGW